MQYETMKSNEIDFTFESKNFSSIFGLYLFSLGSVFSGYSLYLLLEATQSVERYIITWSGQGLFWSLILFFIALFVLFIPVEFLNIFKIYNSTFKDLIVNVILVIFISLITLIFFQFLLNPTNLVTNDIVDIGKATSFSGFIAIPLVLFLQHNLKRSVDFSDNLSFSIICFLWIMSSQFFL